MRTDIIKMNVNKDFEIIVPGYVFYTYLGENTLIAMGYQTYLISIKELT